MVLGSESDVGGSFVVQATSKGTRPDVADKKGDQLVGVLSWMGASWRSS